MGGCAYIQKLPLLILFFLHGLYLLVCQTRPWYHAPHFQHYVCVFPLPTHTHKGAHFPSSCNHLISSKNTYMQILTVAELTDFIIKHNTFLITLFKHDSSSVWRCSPSLLLPSPSSLLSSHSPLLFLSESRLIGRQTSWPSTSPTPQAHL